jgi:hypothetical protein
MSGTENGTGPHYFVHYYGWRDKYVAVTPILSTAALT